MVVPVAIVVGLYLAIELAWQYLRPEARRLRQLRRVDRRKDPGCRS